MKVILRILGISLLSRLGSRLPEPWPRVVFVAILVFANGFPVLGVWQGWLGFGDVFLLFWLENVMVWLTTIIRVLTAGPDASHGSGTVLPAVFFAFHYGIFTLVHGVFAVIFTVRAGGLTGSASSFVISALLLMGVHTFNLAFYWFAQGGRLTSSPQLSMFAPYPRMVVLHVSVIVAGNFLLGRGVASEGQHQQFWPVLLLCGLKMVVDLVTLAVQSLLATGRFTLEVDGRNLRVRRTPDAAAAPRR